MPNSDIAVGWVDYKGNAHLQDGYTTVRNAPYYDANQNLTLIEGEEANGMTRLRWKRPKYSCDADDMSISHGTTRYFVLRVIHQIIEVVSTYQLNLYID